MLSALRALPATVWTLGAISLLNDAASDLVQPLVPLFVAQVLAAGPRALGAIEGAANATAALLKLASGVLYDRFPRAKGWLVAGYGLPAIARPAIAFAGSVATLGVLRVADRIGKGLRTAPRDALLARSVEPARRGLAFGVHRAMDHAGAVAGPLAAAAFLAAGTGLREVFLWTALPGAACVALALAVREPVPSAPPAARLAWDPAALPPRLRAYLAVVAFFTLSQASGLFLLLRAAQLGVPDAAIPLLWALQSGVAMLLSAPLSSLSDRMPRGRTVVAGWLLYAAVFGGLGARVDSLAGLAALLALHGVVLALTEGVEKALVADLAPADRLGTAYGAFHLASGLMLVPASLGFGWAWERFGAPVAFGASGAIAAAAAVGLVLVLRGVPAR